MKNTSTRKINNYIIIDLNALTPAEKKLYELGGFLAADKYNQNKPYNTTVIEYYECGGRKVSEHEVSVLSNYHFQSSIIFNNNNKSIKTNAALSYKMLCAVMERCKELGWDKE
jgi:hypothetical protein